MHSWTNEILDPARPARGRTGRKRQPRVRAQVLLDFLMQNSQIVTITQAERDISERPLQLQVEAGLMAIGLLTLKTVCTSWAIVIELLRVSHENIALPCVART